MNSSAFLHTLGGNSLQAAVLVVLVLSAQWLFRRQLSPAWRSALWLLVVVRLLLPVSAGSAVSIFNLTPALRPATPVATATVTADEFAATSPAGEAFAARPTGPVTVVASVPARFNFSWPQALLGVWFAGAVFLLARLIVGSFRLSRRVRGTACTDPAVLAVLDDCVRQTGLRRTPALVESEAIATPAVFGLFRPRLLFPPGFRQTFSAGQLRHVFLHELAHLRRHDLWINSLMAVIQAIHWFNPLVWLGFARWRLERELACDASALEALGDRHQRDYGETILQLLQQSPDRRLAPGLIGISEDRRQLRQRIAQIAQFRPTRRVPLLAVALTCALAAVALTDASAQKPAGPVATAQPKEVAAAAPQGEVRSIEFHVVDGATGQPVAGATVSWSYDPAYPPVPTDAAGLATLTVPVDPSRNGRIFMVTVKSPRHSDQRFQWIGRSGNVWSELPARQEVTLRAGFSIGGVVRDERGAPIAGARVAIHSSGPATSREVNRVSFTEFPILEQRQEESPITDAQGAWRQGQLPADARYVAITVTRPDGAETTFSTQGRGPDLPGGETPPISMDEARNGSLVFTLPEGVAFRGTVTDANGRPLAGAELRAKPAGTGQTPRVFRTDANGNFESPHWTDPNALVTAELAGYRMTSATLPVGAADNRIALGPVVPLKMRVLDTEGRPLPNAEVRSHVVSTSFPITTWRGTTDREGRVEWTNAPEGTLTLFVSLSGRPRILGDAKLVADGTEQIIRLKRAPDVARN